MYTPLRSLLVFSSLLLTTGLCAAKSDGSAANAFKQLSSLVGAWEGKFEDGRPHSVSYRLSAGGTVLVVDSISGEQLMKVLFQFFDRWMHQSTVTR